MATKADKAKRADAIFEHISREVKLHDAPALHEAVQRLADKAGIEKPAIRIYDSKKLKQASPLLVPMRYNASMKVVGKPDLMLGDLLLEHLTGDRHGKSVSKELEAVIGHEFGHSKYGRHALSPERLSTKMPMTGLLSAVGGLALYHYFHRHPEQQGILQQAVAQDEESNAVAPVKKALHPAIYASLINAQYIAASGLGLTGGVLGFQTLRHHAEFRCDRVGAELAGADAMASALKMLTEPTDAIRKQIRADKLESARMHNIPEEFLVMLERLKAKVGQFTHPPTEERIAKMEKQAAKSLVEEASALGKVALAAMKTV